MSRYTRTDDRLIHWCEHRGIGVDIDFRTGKTVLKGAKRRTFSSIEDALKWAQAFSKRWSLPEP